MADFDGESQFHADSHMSGHFYQVGSDSVLVPDQIQSIIICSAGNTQNLQLVTIVDVSEVYPGSLDPASRK